MAAPLYARVKCRMVPACLPAVRVLYNAARSASNCVWVAETAAFLDALPAANGAGGLSNSIMTATDVASSSGVSCSATPFLNS